MSNASVYVTGQNLCYFTGYSGVSPEPAVDTYYGQGIDMVDIRLLRLSLWVYL